jgi:plastocyanin
MQMYQRIVVGVFAALAMGCGSDSSTGTPVTGTPTGTPPGTNGGSTSSSITVADNSFTPSETTVSVGTTVTWTWNASTQHNVTFNDGSASATQASGTFARAFNAAGTYNYHCTIHGASMSGSVTVK